MDNMIGRQLNVQARQQKDASTVQSDFAPREFIIKGRFRVDGLGMANRDITFPVQFTEEPHFIAGAVLDDNQQLVTNFWPEHQITVVQWFTQQNGIGNALYKGARLIVLTRGGPNQRIWVNWQASGIGLVNPIGGAGTTEGTI